MLIREIWSIWKAAVSGIDAPQSTRGRDLSRVAFGVEYAGEMLGPTPRRGDDHVEAEVEIAGGGVGGEPHRGGAGDAPATCRSHGHVASSWVSRRLTSTKAICRPRRTIRSISPTGVL